MRFPADLASARAARDWAARSADEHGASDRAVRTVRLLVSELVTNAVTYGPSDGGIDVEMRFANGSVRVLVTDESPGRPEVLDPPPEALGGRGMRLVEGLSTSWGVVAAGQGKTVWLELGLT